VHGCWILACAGMTSVQAPVSGLALSQTIHEPQSSQCPDIPAIPQPVIPAKAGIQCELQQCSRDVQAVLDSRVRGNDERAGACERTRTEPEDSRAPAVPAPRDPRCARRPGYLVPCLRTFTATYVFTVTSHQRVARGGRAVHRQARGSGMFYAPEARTPIGA